MRTCILLGVLFLILTSEAQVTIGSNNSPLSSALLELKERESTPVDLSTSNKGLIYPRVALKKTHELYPMYSEGYPDVSDIIAKKQANTGLIVYNITNNNKADNKLDTFIPGLYIWTGDRWNLLQSTTVVEPLIGDLLCESATLSPSSYKSNEAYKGILTIPYTGGNGGFYNRQEKITVNGLTFTLQEGKLNIGNGEIHYTVTGTPTVSSPEITSIPINFLGHNCFARVGNVQEIKTINFAKTVATNFSTTDVTEKTLTILGNLSVRVEWVRINTLGTHSYYLTYKVNQPTHVTVLYTKSGKSVGYVVSGRKAAKNTGLWYRIKAGAYYDEELVLDDWSSAGPQGAKDDINPDNRDVVEAILMFHNTNEVYRVTINSNGFIPADGPIPAVSPTITIFLEKLD